MTADIRIVVLSKLTVGEEFARFREHRRIEKSREAAALAAKELELERLRRRRNYHVNSVCHMKLRRTDSGWVCPECGKVFR